MDEVMNFLVSRDGADEPAKVTTYRVYIDSREVTVNTLDRGSQAGELRFAVEAYFSSLSPEERDTAGWGYSMGNPDRELRAALSNVHWNQLRARD